MKVQSTGGVLTLRILTISAALATGTASAHHSTAMYDREKTLSAPAVVAKVEWSNPHTTFWFYIKNAEGKYDLYAMASDSVNTMMRRGWTKNTLAVGEKVVIRYNPLKDAGLGGFFVDATHADGKVSSVKGEPGK
jgi:hypothetical protein